FESPKGRQDSSNALIRKRVGAFCFGCAIRAPPRAHNSRMIKVPHTFEHTLDFELDDEAIAHVFVRDALVQFGDTPGALPWRFYRQAGLVAGRVHGIGRVEGRKHLAVALPDEFGAESLPDGLRAAGLRSWFGVLDDASLAIAMRGVQLVEWDRTHRFCGACGTPTERVGHERARRCPSCGL